MSERLSSVEQQAEVRKHRAKIRAEEKLSKNRSWYEQRAESLVQTRINAGLTEKLHEVTAESVAISEAAKEVLIDEYYGENIQLEGGASLIPVGDSEQIDSGKSPFLSGESREELVSKLNEEPYEKLEDGYNAFVVDRLDAELNPTGEYEAIELISTREPL